MTCDEMGPLLIDLHSGALPPEDAEVLRQHLGGCARCAGAEREELLLTELLRSRLPTPSAPRRLRIDLEAQVARVVADANRRGGTSRVRTWRWPAVALAACSAAIALWVMPRGGAGPSLVEEAVNDHLRAVVAERPDVASGGTHQVRPWFEGRIDFAPPVPDLQELGVHLRGGSVGYFRDRRAAVLQYQLRLHRVTLLVFRADGLALPARRGAAATTRGIHAILWRDGELGFALVSDVDAGELQRIAGRIAG